MFPARFSIVADRLGKMHTHWKMCQKVTIIWQCTPTICFLHFCIVCFAEPPEGVSKSLPKCLSSSQNFSIKETVPSPNVQVCKTQTFLFYIQIFSICQVKVLYQFFNCNTVTTNKIIIDVIQPILCLEWLFYYFV